MSVLEQNVDTNVTGTLDAVTPPVTKRPRREKEPKERGVVSFSDRKKTSVRVGLWTVQGLMLVGLIIVGLGPLAWSAKAAVSSSQNIISNPMGIWFTPNFWGNLVTAWNGAQIGQALANSAFLAIGSAIATLFVSTTGAYLLSVLRPKWGPILSGAVLATLFLPGVISLVPLYMTILHMPLLGISLQDSFWAVWLPAGASAFNVVVLKRFFDSIPRELIEAAHIDGAGALRVFLTIIIPLSKPIIGVVALLTIIASWKDFLWPMLVLPNTNLQPASVALETLSSGSTDFAIQLAGVFLTTIVPVVVFLIFQKQFLRGVGSAGGIKG
ncbi:MAG: binding-protein-dependent transport system inner rane component [Frondihabitans sp.]|nr:binding-protein-dependent transport system inner rane component [Frondihabitans sp.]